MKHICLRLRILKILLLNFLWMFSIVYLSNPCTDCNYLTGT